MRATALIVLGRAAGYRIWVTGRSEEKRAAALALPGDALIPAADSRRGWACSTLTTRRE